MRPGPPSLSVVPDAGPVSPVPVAAFALALDALVGEAGSLALAGFGCVALDGILVCLDGILVCHPSLLRLLSSAPYLCPDVRETWAQLM
jgi:hypothetical protein